jgi:undecaprenyl-diphosphatase
LRRLRPISSFLSRRKAKLAIFLAAFTAFILIAVFISSPGNLDRTVSSWIDLNRNTFLTQTSLVFQYAFDAPAMFFVTAALVVYLFVSKRKRFAFLLAGAMLGEWIVYETVKIMIHIPRPDNAVIFLSEFAFPSGHVTSATVLFGISTYIFWHSWSLIRTKTLLVTLLAVLGLMLGGSRIYLNVHWVGDVLAAYFLGLSWIVLVVIGFESIQELMDRKKETSKRSLTTGK